VNCAEPANLPAPAAPPGDRVAGTETRFPVVDYDLAATLDSGQVFRWTPYDGGWEGVVRRHWVRLEQTPGVITAKTSVPVNDWDWLAEFLQAEVRLRVVLATFPDDEPMRRAVAACRGLRLLRQDPWECLASFICSSTKQIVQIRQIIALLCERHGDPIPAPACRQHPAGETDLPVPAMSAIGHAFPTPAQIAVLTESDLRACKLGFRAPYLLHTARAVAGGAIDLEALRGLSCDEARTRLMELPGVGRKVADCVLLFAYGFQAAFPVDVWVMKAMLEHYFKRRHRIAPRQVWDFTARHFGPHAGYAQQYLFHHARMNRFNPPRTRIQ
jgi:N-glycosylase/DNA lyase